MCPLDTVKGGAASAASRLSRNVKVQARIVELQTVAAAKTEMTVARLTNMFLADRKLAHENKQIAAAVSATVQIVKLYGLFVKRFKWQGRGRIAERIK